MGYQKRQIFKGLVRADPTHTGWCDTGPLKQPSSDLLLPDVTLLIKFLKEIPDGTVVMMATFDDPATK